MCLDSMYNGENEISQRTKTKRFPPSIWGVYFILHCNRFSYFCSQQCHFCCYVLHRMQKQQSSATKSNLCFSQTSVCNFGQWRSTQPFLLVPTPLLLNPIIINTFKVITPDQLGTKHSFPKVLGGCAPWQCYHRPTKHPHDAVAHTPHGDIW